jgi:hypothetical protein
MASIVLQFFCIVMTHYLQHNIVERAHLSSLIVSTLCTVVSPTGHIKGIKFPVFDEPIVSDM